MLCVFALPFNNMLFDCWISFPDLFWALKMPNTSAAFEVPLVPPDLRREETIKQICDSLEYLEKVANDVFTRIGSKVADNHKRLRTINDRVNLAQAKIDKIKGSNKATKVSAEFLITGHFVCVVKLYRDKLMGIKFFQNFNFRMLINCSSFKHFEFQMLFASRFK